jgi:hypothetical protein
MQGQRDNLKDSGWLEILLLFFHTFHEMDTYVINN